MFSHQTYVIRTLKGALSPGCFRSSSAKIITYYLITLSTKGLCKTNMEISNVKLNYGISNPQGKQQQQQQQQQQHQQQFKIAGVQNGR